MGAEEEKKLRQEVLYNFEEARRQLKQHKIAADEIARSLSSLCDLLQKDPKSVALYEYSLSHTSGRDGVEYFDPSMINAKRIAEVCEAIRYWESEVQRLKADKRDLGYPVD